MEDLPDALLAEIVKRITTGSDQNSLSLVSKRLYNIDAEQRGAIRVGCGLHPPTEAIASLCTRFPNLWKVEINYSDWAGGHWNQIDNQGLHMLSTRCPSLSDLTLSFCSYIDDAGLGFLASCKKLLHLQLDSTTKITSGGLLSVAIGCKNLSALHLTNCNGITGSIQWLEYLGTNGSLEELVVKNCDGIGHYDLLKFGPGWMKLQKFEYEKKGPYDIWDAFGRNPNTSYLDHYLYQFRSERLKVLRLAHVVTEPEIGLCFLLRKCKDLEKLCLEYVNGVSDSDMITISQSCNNLRSISLWLVPRFRIGPHGRNFTTAFTDESLNALALGCPMLQAVELTFAGCESMYPSEIGFTQKGLLKLVQSCPIRVLALNGANFFDDEGMKAISSAPFLETLDLVDCKAVTDSGMCFMVHSSSLINLTLRYCIRVSDAGVAKLVHAHKLHSLIVYGCPMVSLKAVEGGARSVHYEFRGSASPGYFKRMFQ